MYNYNFITIHEMNKNVKLTWTVSIVITEAL